MRRAQLLITREETRHLQFYTGLYLNRDRLFYRICGWAGTPRRENYRPGVKPFGSWPARPLPGMSTRGQVTTGAWSISAALIRALSEAGCVLLLATTPAMTCT